MAGSTPSSSPSPTCKVVSKESGSTPGSSSTTSSAESPKDAVISWHPTSRWRPLTASPSPRGSVATAISSSARIFRASASCRGTTRRRSCWPISRACTAIRSLPRPVRSCRRKRHASPSTAGPALAGTELEFIVFNDTYEEAWASGYRALTPANQYNVDYSIQGTSRIEPLLGRIRRSMRGAGMVVESVKGECNFGQHEIAFRYCEIVEKADEHSLFKLGAKEIAAQEGVSLTFMAKYDQREGNSCHIHISLRDEDGRAGLLRRRVARLLGSLRALPRRHHLDGARAVVILRPEREQLQALLPGVVRADRAALGHRQPDLRIPGRRPGSVASGRVPDPRRRRQPVPRDRGARRGRSARRRATSWRSLRPSSATPTRQTPLGCRLRSEKRLSSSTRARSRGLRRRGRRPLRQRGEHRSRGVLGRRHRLGAFPGLRAAVSTDVPGCQSRHGGRAPDRRVRSTSTRPTGRSRERRGAAGLARGGSSGSGPAAPPLRRGRRRAPRGTRGDRGRERGAHDRQRPLGGAECSRRARLLLRRSRTSLRTADPRRGRGRPHVLRTARGRRHHRALELPDADRRLGFRAGTGRRQYRRLEACRGDAAVRHPPRRARPRSGPTRRCLPGPSGQGRRRGVAVRHPRGRPKGLLHRVEPGRQAGDGRLRRAGQARHPRARRQEREHRLRRCRPRACRGERSLRGLRQRRPGLLRTISPPRRGPCL